MKVVDPTRKCSVASTDQGFTIAAHITYDPDSASEQENERCNDHDYDQADQYEVRQV